MTILSKAEQPLLRRYDGIDILKAICAFLIVCIHCPFPGEVGWYVVALARIAVPIFFMITGFFYDGTVTRNDRGKKMKKMAVLLCFVAPILVYLVSITFVLCVRLVGEKWKMKW